MNFRLALRWPITLAIVMITLLVIVIVGWVLLSVFGVLDDPQSAPFYWTWLTIGTTILALLIVGTVFYLVLSIKSVNLNRRQSNFIDSVTHELKSPIASLKLYLQTLSRRQVPREQEADFYQYMLEDIERLDSLINHLLEVGRLERGSQDREIGEVELSAMLRQCAETVAMRYRLPIDNVHIESPACIVRGSKVDLDMIFRNLIDNAIKYGGHEPQVRVKVELLPGERVGVMVADNGPGIPKNLRRKIFARFVRLGSELEREKVGTGLGLYIVRTLVRRHRGIIRVHDGDDGHGTVFEVELPEARPVEVESKPTASPAKPDRVAAI